MKLLLDTCTFLWMIDSVEHLSPVAREKLEDRGNELVLHQASAWEIQLKHQSGKLHLKKDPAEMIREGLQKHEVAYRTLRDAEIWHLAKLPDHHRDPFDRILISAALCHGMKLVTPDSRIQSYPVPVIW
ncbi:MAG: type II toxin-antitoxin system VapC family toxin [Opitutales bacterium]